MHRCCFLFVVVFALVTCCYSLADAEGIITIKDSALDSTRGSKTTTDEERAFPGITSLKTLMQKTPHVDKLKSMVKENPALAQANVFVSKRPRLKAALLIVKGQLKPLAIIGALALTGGYIMYLVKK
ncbi:hypothetical protein GQ600_5800 [Phytophthora cactorum]|nr:hypothetical protein GQ600_5800 [Phytophthora cactorum]